MSKRARTESSVKEAAHCACCSKNSTWWVWRNSGLEVTLQAETEEEASQLLSHAIYHRLSLELKPRKSYLKQRVNHLQERHTTTKTAELDRVESLAGRSDVGQDTSRAIRRFVQDMPCPKLERARQKLEFVAERLEFVKDKLSSTSGSQPPIVLNQMDIDDWFVSILEKHGRQKMDEVFEEGWTYYDDQRGRQPVFVSFEEQDK